MSNLPVFKQGNLAVDWYWVLLVGETQYLPMTQASNSSYFSYAGLLMSIRDVVDVGSVCDYDEYRQLHDDVGMLTAQNKEYADKIRGLERDVEYAKGSMARQHHIDAMYEEAGW